MKHFSGVSVDEATGEVETHVISGEVRTLPSGGGDELCIIDVALTQDEVRDLMEQNKLPR